MKRLLYGTSAPVQYGKRPTMNLQEECTYVCTAFAVIIMSSTIPYRTRSRTGSGESRLGNPAIFSRFSADKGQIIRIHSKIVAKRGDSSPKIAISSRIKKIYLEFECTHFKRVFLNCALFACAGSLAKSVDYTCY